MAPLDTQRKCDTCKTVKPLTPRYFPHVVGCSVAFQMTCKACKKKARRVKAMEKAEAIAVDRFIRSQKTGGSNVPHTAELLEGIMRQFGGADGFATILHKQYLDSKPGSRIRNGIIEATIRLTSKNTEAGGAKKPATLLTDQELEDAINERIAQAVGSKHVRIIDATQEETAGALPAPGPQYQFNLPVPPGGTEGVASRIEREAHRSLEALQANPEAMGIPPVHGQ